MMKNPLKNLLPKTDAQLKAENEQLRQEIERLNAVNRDLQKLAEGAPVKQVPETSGNEMLTLSFVNDGVKYGFNFPALQLGGKKITAVDICADNQLQAELIGKKSGILKRLT